MYRTLLYSGLFVATALLQIFLFDNLTVGIWLNPLIYIAFIVLLPLNTPHIALLGLGLLTGMVMDYLMGAAGLNVIATLPVAFMRPWILSLVSKRDDSRDGGIPCAERLGRLTFLRYLILMVVLHHTLFFLFEALSWSHLFFTVVRIVASSILSVGFVWIIARLFTTKFPVRV